MKYLLLSFILLVIPFSTTTADDYLLDYEGMYGDIEAHEKFCEMNQNREIAEDVCYEYNVNEAMKNGVYTIEEMKKINKEWKKYKESFN